MARPKNTVDQGEISYEVDQVPQEGVSVDEPAQKVWANVPQETVPQETVPQETVPQETGKKALAFRRLDDTFWVILKDEIIAVSATDPNNDLCVVNNTTVKTSISKTIEALGWDVKNV